MLKLFRVFIDICLLRARPDDLPESSALLGLTLGLYTLTTLALAADTLSPASVVLYGLVNSLILAVLTHTFLMLRRFPGRLTQTLTALAGSGALLNLFALPLGSATQPSFIVIAFLIWSIAISANILRYALAVSLLRGISTSIVYLVITFIVVKSLFPVLAQT